MRIRLQNAPETTDLLATVCWGIRERATWPYVSVVTWVDIAHKIDPVRNEVALYADANNAAWYVRCGGRVTECAVVLQRKALS